MMYDFNSDKCLQASAFLLTQCLAHKTPFFRFFNLLYLADRESMEKSGHVISGGEVVASKEGLIPVEAYSIIDDDHILHKHFCIHILRHPGHGALSKHNIEILQNIVDEFCPKSHEEFFRYVLDLPEWKANRPKNLDDKNPISLHDMLDSVGRVDDIKSIEDDIIASNSFGRILGGLR